MRQMVVSAGIRPGIVKVGSVSKVTTIATKLPFDLLDSLCCLFLRNLTFVGGAVVLGAICLPRFSRHSASCCSGVLVMPRSKVGTACMRKEIPAWRSLVVLQVVPDSAEIWERRASMLALILDAGALGVVVTTMLPFFLRRTPIGRASLLLHFVSSAVVMPCSLGRVGVRCVWLLVAIMRSLSSLGYVLAQAGGGTGACCCEGLAAAATAAWAKVFAFSLPLFVTSAQSSAWIRGALEGAGVLRMGRCGGCCCSCAYWASVWLVICPVPSKFAAPGRSVAGGGGAYSCWYS